MAATCRFCCPECSRHFASLEAFDAHRIGEHRSSDPEMRRRCEHPLDVQDRAGAPRFLEVTTAGECCTLAEPVRPVTVWALRKTPAQQTWLRTLREAPDRATAFGRTPHGPLELFGESKAA